MAKTNGLLYNISDDFGLRSPAIQKTFHTKKSATSIVARVCISMNDEQAHVVYV